MQLIIYLLVLPILWGISLLPFKLFYLFSDFVCFLIYRVFGYRKKVVRSNLQLAFPEKSLEEIKTIEKKFYKHMCDLFMEMVKSLSITEKEIKQRFKFTNLEEIKKYEDQNRSIIFVCGHYASYEWVISMSYHVKHNGYVVYTPLSNKYFDKLVKKIRHNHNSLIIPRSETIKTVIKNKREGNLAGYGLACDQSPQIKKSYYWRNFMGVKVPVITGPEFLAKKFDHPVVFIDIQKVKRGYYEATFKILADNPKDFSEYQITDLFTENLEVQIRNKPEHYLWSHKRWKHKDKVPKEFLD